MAAVKGAGWANAADLLEFCTAQMLEIA